MANWATVKMSLIINTEKTGRFLSFFDPDSKRRFRRAFLESQTITQISEGKSQIKLDCSCAWSGHASFFEGGYTTESGVEYVNIEDVIEECEVTALVGYSKEEGVGFEESFEFVKKSGQLFYRTRDLFPDPESLDDFLDTVQNVAL